MDFVTKIKIIETNVVFSAHERSVNEFLEQVGGTPQVQHFINAAGGNKGAKYTTIITWAELDD